MKKCIMCDHIEPDHKINCSACGSYLLPIQEKKAVTKSDGVRETPVIKCGVCGKMNYSDRTRCEDCGAELEKLSAEIQKDNLEAHPVCLLVSFLLLIWEVYMVICFSDNSVHPIIPYIYDFDSGLPEFFMFAAWGGAIFSFVVFCGLCGKMRWAGKMFAVSSSISVSILVMADMIDWLFRNDTGFSIKTHNRLYFWCVVAIIVLLGSCVSRYYRRHLDDMCDIPSDNE